MQTTLKMVISRRVEALPNVNLLRKGNTEIVEISADIVSTRTSLMTFIVSIAESVSKTTTTTATFLPSALPARTFTLSMEPSCLCS